MLTTPILSRYYLLVGLLAITLSSAVQAQTAPTPASDELHIQATGYVDQVPDVMQFSFWIERQGNQLSPLKTQVDQSTEIVLRQLMSQGVEREQIQSYQLSIQPHYERQQAETRQRGFMVTRQIKITLTDTANFDRLIDLALNQGVTRVGQITYGFSDPSAMYQQALLQAFELAQQKAQQLASASGRTLGQVTQLRELHDSPQPMARMASDSMAMNVSEPGQQRVQASLQVSFRLQ